MYNHNVTRTQRTCSNSNCRTLFPGLGHAPLTCSGCRVVVYCNKQCQKAAWKTHKPDCLKWKAVSTGTDEDLELRKRLIQLKEFYGHHFFSFTISANSAVRVFQSRATTTAPFSPRDHFLHLRLSYHPSRDNVTPSTMFRVVDAQIHPLAHFKFCPDVFEKRYNVADAAMKAAVNCLSDGMLPVIVDSAEAGHYVTEVHINQDRYQDDSVAVRSHPKLWLLELKRKVERGHVYNKGVSKSVSAGRESQLGKLCRIPVHERETRVQKWKFVPLTKEEMKDGGYIDLFEAGEAAECEPLPDALAMALQLLLSQI